MQKATFTIGIIAILFATKTFAQESQNPPREQGQIAWQFTEEQLRLFSPPMDATIAEICEWVASDTEHVIQ